MVSGIVCVLSGVLCVFLDETKHKDLDDMIHGSKTINIEEGEKKHVQNGDAGKIITTKD